jgi:hypothetical protein
MPYFQHALVVLQYMCQGVALFAGGLFTGAAVYISLTECPPRTTLTLDGLLALYRSIARRTNALLTLLAAVTSLFAVAAAIMGAGIWWLVAGVAHAVMAAYLLTNARRIVTELEHLDHGPDYPVRGKQLMERRALQFGVLGLIGLFAQYLLLVTR